MNTVRSMFGFWLGFSLVIVLFMNFAHLPYGPRLAVSVMAMVFVVLWGLIEFVHWVYQLGVRKGENRV